MDPISDTSTKKILQSLLPELAKSSSELRTARADTSKALDRISFALVLVNELLDRQETNIKGD